MYVYSYLAYMYILYNLSASYRKPIRLFKVNPIFEIEKYAVLCIEISTSKVNQNLSFTSNSGLF